MNQEVFAPGTPNGWQMPTDRKKDYFTYVASFTAVANAAPQTFNITIDAGSDFYWTALNSFASLDGNTDPILESTYVMPKVNVLITDSGSNRQLMQLPTPIPTIAGTGQRPGFLIHPRLFQRNSNIQVQVVSFDANDTYDVLVLSFVGFKMYY